MGPDTSAHTACSTTLNGELYVFGGHETSIKQVISHNHYDNGIIPMHFVFKLIS